MLAPSVNGWRGQGKDKSDEREAIRYNGGMAIKLEGLCPLIQVFDMPTSVRFYRDVLGFSVGGSSPPRSPDDFDWALLKLDGMELMLNTAYDHDSRPSAPARIVPHGDTALFFGCRDLDGAYTHLRAHGVEAKPPEVAHYGMRQIWFKDPDGYVICLQWAANDRDVGLSRS